jgi:hypothetical protein
MSGSALRLARWLAWLLQLELELALAVWAAYGLVPERASRLQPASRLALATESRLEIDKVSVCSSAVELRSGRRRSPSATGV